MSIDGNRKFFVVCGALVLSSVLSLVAMLTAPKDAVALIVAIGGNVTALMVPFMTANYGEHKQKKMLN